MKHLRYLIAFVIVMGISATGEFHAQSQSQNLPTLTLEDAISLALDRNYQIARSEYRVESERARVRSSYGNFLPNLNIGAGLRHTDTRGIRYIDGQPIGTSAAITNYSTGISSNVTIFDGFSNISDLNRSRYDQSVSEYSLENTRRFVVTRVYTMYFDVFRRKELLRVSEENLRRSQAQLGRIIESNRVGAVPIVDVYRQRVQVGNDELALIQAEQNLENAKADLVFFLGLNPVQTYDFDSAGVPTTISEEVIEQNLNRFRDFQELQRRTITHRPDLEAAQHRIYSAEAGLTSARGSYWPSVSLGADYGYSSDQISTLEDNRSFGYRLTFSIPLFQRFQRGNQVQQARVQKKQAEVEYNELQNEALLDIRKAILSLEAAAKRVEVTDQNIIAAREEQRLAEERYNLGAGTLLDLIVANANLAQAESNNVEAIFGFHLAVKEIENLIGEELY